MFCVLLLTLALFVAESSAFLSYRNPLWEPSFLMNQSTLAMVLYPSGWYPPKLAGSFGLVSFDWSTDKIDWANAKPMDCEERLVRMAVTTKQANPLTKVFVYRNLVKALPWYTNVRTKLDDPSFAGWFIRFRDNGTGSGYHVPPCTNAAGAQKCSPFYHDQEQTPEYPKGDGSCKEPCDCGDAPCGEYVWNHANGSSLQEYLLKEVVFGNTGLAHPAIDGLFMDDYWCSDLVNGSHGCNDPAQGPTEVDKHFVADTASTDNAVKQQMLAWLSTINLVEEAIWQAKKYTWWLMPGQVNANAMPVVVQRGNCMALLQRACGPNGQNPWNDAPLLAGLSPGKAMDSTRTSGRFDAVRRSANNRPRFSSGWESGLANRFNASLHYSPLLGSDVTKVFPNATQQIASFLLMRGPFAWIGLGTWGMVWGTATPLPAAFFADYGAPIVPCMQTSTGVFHRTYEKAEVRVDCPAWSASVVPRS